MDFLNKQLQWAAKQIDSLIEFQQELKTRMQDLIKEKQEQIELVKKGNQQKLEEALPNNQNYEIDEQNSDSQNNDYHEQANNNINTISSQNQNVDVYNKSFNQNTQDNQKDIQPSNMLNNRFVKSQSNLQTEKDNNFPQTSQSIYPGVLNMQNVPLTGHQFQQQLQKQIQEQNKTKQLLQNIETSYQNLDLEAFNNLLKDCKNFKDLDLDFIDLNKVYLDGNTLLEKCVVEKKYGRVRMYCENKLKGVYDKEKFFEYVQQNKLQAVWCLIMEGFNPEEPNKYSQRSATALMYACMYNHLRIVKVLVEQFQVNLNQQDLIGNTSFIYACYYKNIDIIKFLLKQRVRYDIFNNRGRQGIDYLEYNDKQEITNFMKKEKLE